MGEFIEEMKKNKGTREKIANFFKPKRGKGSSTGGKQKKTKLKNIKKNKSDPIN